MADTPMFKTVKELQIKIDEFWQYIKDNNVMPTVERLAVILGCTRECILKYEFKDEFVSTIKECKQKILAYKVEALINPMGRNSVGLMFDLKNNYNYSDKQEISLNTTVNHVNSLTDEQLQAQILDLAKRIEGK